MASTAVDEVKVSVLNWNESLRNIEESYGLFMVRFTNNTTNKKVPRNRKISPSFDNRFKVSEFDSISLLTPDSMELMVSRSMEGCFSFLSDEEEARTRRRLTRALSAYLFTYFIVYRDQYQERRKPRIVIVVDLHVPNSSTNKICSIRNQIGASRSDPSCVPGELSNEETKKIRRTLLFLLQEPIVLGGEPLKVIREPEGLHQAQEQLDHSDEWDDAFSEVDNACSIC